ncbi:MAG: hypothetical protein IPJ88_07515 [Myxococcales bacterium]|nr:MAG: hypothetical protein IPJ88_07515 [Myxococcales bacterium]
MNALLKSYRIALLFSGLLGLALCTLPLVGLIGQESSIILGLIMPSLAAWCAVRYTVYEQTSADFRFDFEFLWRSLRRTLFLLLVPTTLLLVNALRLRWCNPFEKLGYFAYGPLFGVILATIVGASVPLIVRHRAAATGLALGLPLLEIVLSVYTLWSSPGIFAYGHFFGFFPGTLYDVGAGFPDKYGEFRAFSMTVMACFGLFIATFVMWRDCVLGARALRDRFSLLCATVLSAALVAFVWQQSDRFAFVSSTSSIQMALGSSAEGQYCHVLAPADWSKHERLLFVRECDSHAASIAQSLGIKIKDKITVYVFKDVEQKRKLMGAQQTMIAKPWRREVFVQQGLFPHSALRHELVHAVAAQIGRGPFAVAGHWGGWLPEPALIEGLAVAFGSPPGELSIHQWVKAMMEVGLAPRLSELFGLSFLRQASRRAYMMAGSVIRFLYERYGSKKLRLLYRSADVKQAYGRTWVSIEKEWKSFLAKQSLPAQGLAFATATFSPQSIFDQSCPHRSARLNQELSMSMGAQDYSAMLRNCAALQSMGHEEGHVLSVKVYALAWQGRFTQAKQLLDDIEKRDGKHSLFLASALEHYADALWSRQRFSEAQRLYQNLRALPLPSERLRALELKSLAIALAGQERELLYMILTQPSPQQSKGMRIVALASKLQELREDGLAQYLSARQCFLRQIMPWLSRY